MFEGFDGWLRVSDDTTPAAEKPYTVSEFIDHCNFALEREFADILIEGEVASFKINQGKWVFFDLKDAETSISCFMVLSQLTSPITDGMKIRVQARPKLTRWGKFSLTVRKIMPIGEGNIKKSFELLKKKLTAEGLFDQAKKRALPARIETIGVISSTNAAGYIDFLKILNNRWGGIKIQTINTQVQGMAAAEQITRALHFFNEHGSVDVIAILRGGGSADDLAAFNDELLVRAIAASKIPTITGIGHEVDESLADLAADVRASTPSNAAERLSLDRQALSEQLRLQLQNLKRRLLDEITRLQTQNSEHLKDLHDAILNQISQSIRHVAEAQKLLQSLNPENVLKRGYAIITGKLSPGSSYQVGNVVKITTSIQNLTAEITNAEKRALENHHTTNQ